MVAVILLIGLMFFTWGAAVYAVYAEPDTTSGEASSDEDSYYDAA
jgi:hypothetical protein